MVVAVKYFASGRLAVASKLVSGTLPVIGVPVGLPLASNHSHLAE